MKKNLTELVFIIDQSGSMSGFVTDTIGGFNSTLKKQKAEEGECLVSTVLFDSETSVLHDRVPISKINEMTERDYTPNGYTALLDAVGGAIHHIGNVHKYAREEDVPERTIFVITTDGMEIASRRYSRDRIREMIKRQTEKYGWEFIFLGANIDSAETAGSLGINEERAANYCQSREGFTNCYDAIDSYISMSRRSVPKEDIDREWKRKLTK